MAHTIVSFSESLDPAGAEVFLAAVPDQQVRTEGDDLVVPNINNVIGAYACLGTTGVLAKLVSPKLRRENPYQISKTFLGLVAAGSSYFGMHPQSPIPLDINESLNAQVNADPAAAEQLSVVVFMAPGQVNPVQGNLISVRFSATVALVAGQYAFANIDLVDELPVGNYNIVGGDMIIPNGVAFRFVPVGDALRPGAPTRGTVGDEQDMVFRRGNLGVWTSFNTTQLPSIEVLGAAATGSTQYFGTMDVIPS